VNLHRLTIAAVIAGLLASTTYVVLNPGGRRTATLEFTRAVNLHEGDDVRVLGVRIGEVMSVRPDGDHVAVGIGYDRPVPADAKAVIVTPSVISGRFVQLTPAYTHGPQLADGAVIDKDRTAVPVEWDDLKDQLTRLSKALAQNGSQQDGSQQNGSLPKAIDTAAANLQGNGGSIRQTITDLAKAASTLAAGSNDLFGTINNLQVLITALNGADQQVRTFSAQLTAIAKLVDDNKNELSAALKALDRATAEVADFVAHHADRLGVTVGQLADVTKILADDRAELAEILHQAPTTLADTLALFDPSTNTLQARLAINNTQDLAGFTCITLFSLGGTPDECRKTLDPLLHMLNMNTVPVALNPPSLPTLLLGGGR
jgi:phospholipid/cholesterol/gamma-HCH transport system substrate-binding protein